MAHSVHKSASTGRFVRSNTGARHRGKTVTQTVGGNAKGYRSAITGRFVKETTADRHPDTTIREG